MEFRRVLFRSSRFGCDPEREHVDAAIAAARGDVLRPGGGSAIMVPGHAPIAGPGFDGRYNHGGDARINVGSRRRRVGSGHGWTPRREEGKDGKRGEVGKSV